MTAAETRGHVDLMERAAGRAVLALHAFEDAPDAPGRIIAGRALLDAVRATARIAENLAAELVEIGLVP